MSQAAKILIVDDTPANIRLLASLLTVNGYDVETAASGEEGLKKVAEYRPDLLLLDIMMPGMNGYDVCRAIRADPTTGVLPVVLVTSLDPAQERIKGLEAGADDFLTKPINQAELLARVKSLLRIKSLYDQIDGKNAELAEWNRTLEQRVADSVAQIERMGRMRRFFSPQIAELILSGGTDDPMKSHRREITVVFLDLRGFTAFTETADPEEVMGVLREYHADMGNIIMLHQGTIEHFAGDGIMIFFNDPMVVENPAERAVRMAMELHRSFENLSTRWQKRGYNLNMGIGIAQGYATLGMIGFEGRFDYGAIGTVTNLAARLCAEAKAGQTLVGRRVLSEIESLADAESLGEVALKGFARPVSMFNIMRLRA
jgi:class 3 adenylate cyclase/CheY-like chemotaxis protein